MTEIAVRSKWIEKANVSTRLVIFKMLDTFLYPKLYGDYTSLKSMTNNSHLYALMYISKIITRFIFENSNNSKLQIVLDLTQKSWNGLLAASSSPALQFSATLTSHATSRGTKAADAGNQEPNFALKQWKLHKHLTEEKRDDNNYYLTRHSENVVARICTVSLREGEWYYLRALLLHVPEATLFADKRSVGGEAHTAYRKACFHRGLLSDDAEWKRALRDSFESVIQPPTELMAMILAHGVPSNPKQFFEDFKDTFIADIRTRFWLQPLLADAKIVLQYVLTKI